MKLGVLDVLALIFVVLKLIGVIDWSWWLVLLPVWPVLFLLALYITLIVVAASLPGRPRRKP